MQTTPLTESLLIFLAIACIYHLVKWAKSFNYLDLVLSAFFILLSTITRYDGWFLLLFASILVFLLAYQKKDKVFAKGNLLLFLTLASLGVILWLLWNLMIFGDPLYFAFGPFSAKSQQDLLLSEGRLQTKGNFIYSYFLYFLTVMYNLGVVTTILALVGGIYLYTSKIINKNSKLVLTLLFVPFIFNVVSLYFGHSVIHLPKIFPYTWFNDRYGLMILPAAAVFLGFLAKKRSYVFYLLCGLVMLQNINMYLTNDIITIQDGVRGASGEYLDEASGWISKNVDDGLVLVAASSNDSLLFTSGLRLKQFITEGARIYWNESLEDPTKHAKWIIMHKGDLVEKSMRDNDIFLKSYKLVYKDAFSYIYKLDLNTDSKLSEEELPK